jgi:hypothetical protein
MDFDGAGVAFIIWTHRTVLDGGKRVVACMLIWRFPDGTKGRRPCGGIVQATEDASRVVAMSACSEQRTS